ncbi:hypothetical protein EC968_001995 [Mortierella alpina]|nr:hypothetical protein EC968_001995 [Mortierella alpina]
MYNINHRTRLILTYGQRLQLCIYSKNHPGLSLRLLALWATSEFELQRRLTIQTVAKILHNAAMLHALDTNDLQLKKLVTIKRPKMDLALGLWATQFGRLHGRAPQFREYRKQALVFQKLTGIKPSQALTYTSLGSFLRRYGLYGPVKSWNMRGTVRPILEKTGDKKLSDAEILTLAGIGPDAAAESNSNGDDDDDGSLATDEDDNDVDSTILTDSDDSISGDTGMNRGKRADNEKSPIASTGPVVPSIAPKASAELPAADELPASVAPPTPRLEAIARHETTWTEKDVITIMDDSDVDEHMGQDDDSAKNVEHGQPNELVLKTTTVDGTTTKSASGHRSLVVVLDLLDQYMATQELVHMVLEDMKEKKEKELEMNSTSGKTTPTPLSSGDEGSLEETLSSITTVMDDLDESKPMERATRLILRHMHYHLTCTASP